ncbi:MAG: hypothetical protein M1812_003974 [Candelaria pacifica]|nr:MAG: hypothetical protein M1812_003974 [Candelaria pacifica]
MDGATKTAEGVTGVEVAVVDARADLAEGINVLEDEAIAFSVESGIPVAAMLVPDTRADDPHPEVVMFDTQGNNPGAAEKAFPDAEVLVSVLAQPSGNFWQ